jgi:transketolase
MRNAFAAELTRLATEDDRIVLLSGDIGNRLFDDFKGRFPDRFLNCGVAEANMIGVAAGLAMSGYRPVVYTITPFVTTRCLEQIRVDVGYQDVPVTIVGVGAGLSYAQLGATHHACEDIAFLRAIPGMVVVCPGDAHEVTAALRATQSQERPAYIRLGKKGEPLIHGGVPDFSIGKAIKLRDGSDLAVLSCGNLLPLASEVTATLAGQGLDAALWSFHTVKPLDDECLDELCSTFPVIVTVEEHSLIGGFGGAVAEWMVDNRPGGPRVLRIGTRDEFIHEAGPQQHARAWYGLTAESISRRAVAVHAKATEASARTRAQ